MGLFSNPWVMEQLTLSTSSKQKAKGYVTLCCPLGLHILKGTLLLAPRNGKTLRHRINFSKS